MSDLLNMTKLAKCLGVAKSTVHDWQEQGVITAEIEEGKVFRYDLQKVRERLAERAREKREKAAAPLA